MLIFDYDSGASVTGFLFQNVSDAVGVTRRNIFMGLQEGLVKIINLKVVPSSKNLGASMTSISATSNSNYQTPLQMLQAELQSEVNSGAVSSSDQSTLSSALTDINSALQGGNSSSASSSSTTTNNSPGDIQSKISTLIANEVSSGKLTADQATELQGVFSSAFSSASAGGSTGATAAAGGPGGAGGPPPGGPPPGGGAGGVHHGGHGGHGGASATSSTSSTSSSSDSSDSSISDVLQQFLQSLQDSQSSSSSTYSSTGSTTSASDSSASYSALLIDYKT
jgi:hypothetical protein